MQKEHLYIIIASTLFGIITVGGQFFTNKGLSLYELSLFALIFEMIILSIIIAIKPKYLIKKKMIFFFIIYGLIGAVLQLSQFGGITLGVPVAIVAMLLYSQPIWSVIFGKLILNENLTKLKIISVLIAFIGIILLVKPWDIDSVGSISGILIALVGGMSLSLWVVYGRKSGISNQHFITTTLGYTFFSLLWLLVFWPLLRILINDQSIMRLDFSLLGNYWLYFLIFAIIVGVFPHALFYKGLKNIQASSAGIIMLLEPISATILASIFFS
jgi:drug/metabolite transporter (DMT)-like permease